MNFKGFLNESLFPVKFVWLKDLFSVLYFVKYNLLVDICSHNKSLEFSLKETQT